MAEIALEAIDLSFAYPDGPRVLRGLNLSIQQGRRLALLGANGCGKTTLLWHLNGTLQPAGGKVQLAGTLAGYDRKSLLAWRQKVGLVFQDPDDQLFAATVAQDISFGPINLGLAEAQVRQRVAESLAVLEIANLADRPTHMLSFGQKKLAAIAGVLAMRPQIMILDEPTAGLDYQATQQVCQAMARLEKLGTTLVLATHDMDFAYAWADDVAVLADGSVARHGPVAQVFCDRGLLARCHLRMPWALEIALAVQQGSDTSDPGALPKTQAELVAFCQRLCQRPQAAVPL